MLDLLEWAPIVLPPEELARIIGRLGVEKCRDLESYEGRRRFVAEVATVALEDGLEAAEVRYQMAVAGFAGVAITCVDLYLCTGTSCGC
jgi:hypothetical protein